MWPDLPGAKAGFEGTLTNSDYRHICSTCTCHAAVCSGQELLELCRMSHVWLCLEKRSILRSLHGCGLCGVQFPALCIALRFNVVVVPPRCQQHGHLLSPQSHLLAPQRPTII
eukprot:jgi/Ulvmu1/5157/UM021_0174.1